jgi:hypothetical protein
MNFKKFNDIGDSEPRAWNKASAGTRFDDFDDDEVPVPYCDEFEDEEESESEDEEQEQDDTETETESVTSSGKPVKRALRNIGLVLQEETDFMQEK